MFNRFLRRVRRKLFGAQTLMYKKEIGLPDGMTEASLLEFIQGVRVEGAPDAEMMAYGTNDFRRFVHTVNLTDGLSGKCLELGANPYFTTMLLHTFKKFELTLANYFGHENKRIEKQRVFYTDPQNKGKTSIEFEYHHFNIESDEFPFQDHQFDVVIFGEILEHLLTDPCRVLREIKRVLKPNGILILTTPNVSRLENVAKMIKGENIYDPYSGYGPYGRHNREYTLVELKNLLIHEGFETEKAFTADVHPDSTELLMNIKDLQTLVNFRSEELGQYHFIRAKNVGLFASKKPSWLYRSYDADKLD
jgi:SAM-dependent methyltransferase